MKVLIINCEESRAGAARAANRLHQGLKLINVDSKMLVQEKFTDDFTVIQPKSKKRAVLYRAYRYYEQFLKRNYDIKHKVAFSLSLVPDNLKKHIGILKPDIVHLNWFHKGFIKLESLMNIGVPIVWTLHDMWAFTGGCHYTQGCESYLNICGKCPILGSDNPYDISRKLFNRKQKTYNTLRNLHIITPSNWLAECAKKSTLLGNKDISVIPYGIDTTVYKPVPKLLARNLLNIDSDKKIVLFGALRIATEPRKGFNQLAASFEFLTSNNIELVIFGCSRPKDEIDFGFPTRYMGKMYDDISLKVLYSAADVMVVPSIQENLSLSIMESLSCGTPVVGFPIGGNSDMIAHMENGYLAKSVDAEHLAEGINWVLADESRLEILSKNARTSVTKKYSLRDIAAKHLSLYSTLIRANETG